MTKDDLIEAISADAGITKTAAAKALTAFCGHVAAALGAGEEVKLVGFGKFQTKLRPAGFARNPRTSQPVAVGPSAAVRFRAGAELDRHLARLAARETLDAA